MSVYQTKKVEKYPFSLPTASGHVLIDVAGKPLDRRNLQDKDVFKELSEHLEKLGIGHALNPRPVHGNIISSRRFLERSKSQLQTISLSRIPILRGLEADGVLVGQGEAYLLFSADCLTITIVHSTTSLVMAAHFSRESGLRKNILQNVFEKFSRHNPEELSVVLSLGIAPAFFNHSFDHPNYGPHNKELVTDLVRRYGKDVVSGQPEEGCLDLRFLAVQKLVREYGVLPERIWSDTIDTYGDDRFWSYRRGDKERNRVTVANIRVQ